MSQIPFLSDINLNGNDILNVLKIIFRQLSAAPPNPTQGTMYFDGGKLKIFDGTSWNDFITLSANNHVLAFDASHDGLKAVVSLRSSNNNLQLVGDNGYVISSIPFSSITTDIPDFTLSYTSSNHHINLLADGEIISYIDASSFILDGMLDNVVVANITSDLQNTALIRVNPLVANATISNICVRKTTSDAGGRKAWALIDDQTMIYYTASATPAAGDTVYSASSGNTSIGTIAEYKADGVSEGLYLVMVFNTDAGKVDIWVKIPITAYTAGNGINITNGSISLYEDAYWKTETLTAGVESVINILASTHLKGSEPIVTVFDNTYNKVEALIRIYSQDVSSGGSVEHHKGDIQVVAKSYAEAVLHIRVQGFYSSQTHQTVIS